jgi:hypothetical protein
MPVERRVKQSAHADGAKKDFRRYDMLPIVQKATILHASAGSITLPETTWIPF